MAARFFIRRSTTLDNPGTILGAGELAYSYRSNKLFIGSSAGTGHPAVEIRGQSYSEERIYFQQFTQADLGEDNVLTIPHNLDTCPTNAIFWNGIEAFYPDRIASSEDLNTLYIELTSFAPLVGNFYLSISEEGIMKFGLLETLSALRLLVAPGGNYAGLKAPATIATSYTLRLPSGLPTVTQGLQVDASGNLGYFDASNVKAYRTSFTNASLSSGVLALTHNIGRKIVSVQVSDNNDKLIIPDEITLTSDSASSVDLTSYGSLTGTWNVLVLG